MSASSQKVFIVDDDSAVLKALEHLIVAAGLEVRTFASSREFLAQHDPAMPGCVVLDLAMPGLDGLTLQEELVKSGAARPIIFLTGEGKIPQSVRAMKAGAVDFLTKPVDDEALLAAIRTALDRDEAMRRAQEELVAIRHRFAGLTARERQVLELIIAGRLNKQIADELGIGERTVKFHRAHIMEKIAVHSVAELVRFTGLAKVGPSP
jgi:FixJ family two-component response regulator